MKIIVVDDEQLALSNFESVLKELNLSGVEYLRGFSNPLLVMDFVRQNSVDLVFLDVQMPGISGIELAKLLKEYDNNIRIVFLTGYDMYAFQAFEVEAIGYMLKPYRKADLEKKIIKASFVGTKNSLLDNRFFIRTMPKFDIFVDNKVVVFNRSKSKELLAFLVDKRGSTATMEEIITNLWEDREYDNKVKILYREAVMSLRKSLEACGASEIFCIKKGLCYVDTTKFECDYYDLLQKEKNAVKLFAGQYMTEYSWSEETTAFIERFLNDN